MGTGGYRNEGQLTPEHLKLPGALQRRVGAKIRVIDVRQNSVSYVNLQSGLTHFYSFENGEWRWQRAAS